MPMIPVSKPSLGKEEVAAVKKVILSGWVTQGPEVKKFEEEFAAYVGSRHACAVSSCTTALHLALVAVGVELGDVVLTVSHSFIASANSIRHCGAEPVFIDIDPETLNMHPGHLAEFFRTEIEIRNGQVYYKNPFRLACRSKALNRLIVLGVPKNSKKFGRIAAILVVHQVGMPCDLKSIVSLGKKYGVPVVEDAACALGSETSLDNGKTWEKIGKPHGDIACFSFHPRKILTTGDGGMITTNNSRFDKKFRLLRQHGMDVNDLVRHLSRKVIFEHYLVTGFNYRMTDVQAAMGCAQLKKMTKILKRKREITKSYIAGLKDIPWIKPVYEPSYARTNWQSFPVYVRPGAPVSRNKLLALLLDKSIIAKPGVMNAHEQKPYLGFQHSLKESIRANREVILLPHYPGLKERQIGEIIAILKKL